jgi:hypothetical protein
MDVELIAFGPYGAYVAAAVACWAAAEVCLGLSVPVGTLTPTYVPPLYLLVPKPRILTAPAALNPAAWLVFQMKRLVYNFTNVKPVSH